MFAACLCFLSQPYSPVAESELACLSTCVHVQDALFTGSVKSPEVGTPAIDLLAAGQRTVHCDEMSSDAWCCNLPEAETSRLAGV